MSPHPPPPTRDLDPRDPRDPSSTCPSVASRHMHARLPAAASDLLTPVSSFPPQAKLTHRRGRTPSTRRAEYPDTKYLLPPLLLVSMFSERNRTHSRTKAHLSPAARRLGRSAGTARVAVGPTDWRGSGAGERRPGGRRANRGRAHPPPGAQPVDNSDTVRGCPGLQYSSPELSRRSGTGGGSAQLSPVQSHDTFAWRKDNGEQMC